MGDAKHQLDLVPADAIMRATDVTSPMVATAAIRLQARLSDRFNMPVNVVVSNVPGPREPLYLAGAKLDGYIPVSTISNGVGLNITVHSYEDRLDFGLVADRDLVPDLWDLVDLHIDQVDALFEATGAERADTGPEPPPAAPRSKTTSARKRSAKKSSAKKSAKKSTKKAAKKKSPARKAAAKRAAS